MSEEGSGASAPQSRPIGTAVIGLGFMGQTHLAAYQAAAASGYPCRLAAVCDPDQKRLSGRLGASGNLGSGAGEGEGARLFDPAGIVVTTDADAVFVTDDVDVVSICTPTEYHVPLAIAALEAGKHVLVEKPVSLDVAEIERLRDAAASSGRVCMPAMCMRFWPGWDWLRERVRDLSFGSVRSAVFRRLSPVPGWSPFYNDPGRCGGAVVDLHIHDTDFVRFCFGEPESVDTVGDLNHATSFYRYANGPAHVVAEGAWVPSTSFEFRMQYIVVFEHATAEFDLLRDPVLRLVRDDAVETVELPAHSGYDGEVRHFLDAVCGKVAPAVTMADAVATARLLDEERRQVAR